MVGDTDVIAEYKGSYSVSHEFVDHYRGSDKKYDYVWEERWARDAGYGRIIPEVVNGLLKNWAPVWIMSTSWFILVSLSVTTAISLRGWCRCR